MSKFVRTVRVQRLQYTSRAKLLKTLQCRIANQSESKPRQSYLERRLSPVVYQDLNNGIQQPKSSKLNMDHNTPIFQALICGIIAGTEINLIKVDRLHHDIYTNSKNGVTLHTLASVSETSKVMKNCATFQNTPETKNNLIWHWVRGHSGIEGNEVAEKLAKAEVKELFIRFQPFNRTPHNPAKLIVQDQCTDASQDIWLQASGLVNSKILNNASRTKHFRETVVLGKNSFRIVTSAFVEFCGWNEHMSNLKLTASRDYKFCHEAHETPLHLISNCCPQMGIRNSFLDGNKPQPEEVKITGGKKIIQFLNTVSLGSKL